MIHHKGAEIEMMINLKLLEATREKKSYKKGVEPPGPSALSEIFLVKQFQEPFLDKGSQRLPIILV